MHTVLLRGLPFHGKDLCVVVKGGDGRHRQGVGGYCRTFVCRGVDEALEVRAAFFFVGWTSLVVPESRGEDRRLVQLRVH